MKHILHLFFLFLFSSGAFAQETYPVNGSHDVRPGLFAFINATIVVSPEKTITNGTLLIKEKTIEAVGSGISVPKGYVIMDLKGRTIYPSFIDAFGTYGVPEAPRAAFSRRGERGQVFTSTKDGAYAWNEAIKPEMNVKTIFKADEKKADEWRKLGFGAVNSVIKDGIARGTSSVVTLADDKENELFLKDEGSANYSFSKGSAQTDYPSSLMGSIALLRQTYLDAAWYKSQKKEYNISLAEFNRQQTLPQFFELNDALDVLRADRVGDEFGKQFTFVTNGEEYKRIDAIKATGGKFILPLNFPKAYDVEDPTDARNVTYEQLKSWELAPTNPAVMEKAGLTFAITTNGLMNVRDFWTNLRQAIDNGLSQKQALKSLTQTPAELLGISAMTGTLEKGKLANFIVTSGPVFDKENIIYENWVQGRPYTVTRAETSDMRGAYTLSIDGLSNLNLKIGGTPGNYDVSVERTGADSGKTKAAFTRNGDLVSLNFDLKKNPSGSVRLTGYVTGDKNFTLSGESVKPDGTAGKWAAKWASAYSSPAPKKPEQNKQAPGAVIYPFVAYGNKEVPKQETILFKNATVWTNEKDGILQQSDVLISGGKIKAVGKNLSASDAKVIDATGKHITPGIIDEHSHIAISNGINEGTQSVTSEVRIGDIINSDDINIYRQLAGGVTTSHILHGSANTIGGQTQLIKLRWGQTPEQMKFAGWGGFIKFALGENVKQSNWGGNNLTRFPQTRMGVEQVLYDAFTRAKEYQKTYGKKGSTTRRDLELDALVEIMEGKRFITCHSYVQSEINMLMHVADSMKFKVNTFTHILEGYKVADKMKQRGINASTFSDWWAYKMEVQDAIPYNGAIMNKVGLNVAFNSDDAEMARRLNQEAAKAVKYGGVSEEEAFKFVSLNPAKMLHIEDKVGSLKPGKDADVVLWSDNPLSVYAHAEKTYVDGVAYWDESKDAQSEKVMKVDESRIIQKMIASKKQGGATQPARMSIPRLYHCDTLEDQADEESDVFTHYLHNRLFNHH